MKKIYQIIGLVFISAFYLQCSSLESDLAGSSGTGVGGSLAAMTVVGDFLYTLDNQSIKVFNLANPVEPVQVGNTIELDFGVETMFPYNNLLFIGSQTGMYIFDISTASNPQLLAEHEHFFGCDPVVANDSIAFVTVRTIEGCRGFVDFNRLEIVDVSDPTQPFTIADYDLNSPAGLGLDGNHLFVTDGDAGIRVFDVSDPYNATIIGNIPVNAFDVIPLDGLLIAVGAENLYQFDYTDIHQITQLSSLQLRP